MPKNQAAASSTNKTQHAAISMNKNEHTANSMKKISFMSRTIIGKASLDKRKIKNSKKKYFLEKSERIIEHAKSSGTKSVTRGEKIIVQVSRTDISKPLDPRTKISTQKAP